MKLTQINAEQWKQVKEIYMEAFPKAERKPFFVLRHSVKSKKAQILTATEDGTLMGFVMVIPYGGMVMVDYLAVPSKIRSRGTGSQIMQQVCEHFADKRIVLLIERLDDNAENAQQRSARRRFYLKNGFTSSDIFIRRPSLVIPALFTRMSIRPKSFMIWSMTACVSSKLAAFEA